MRHPRFTDDFKTGAVDLALTSGRPHKEIAHDLGIGLSTLTRWIYERRRTDAISGNRPKDDELHRELKRLRQEVRILRQERDILKKATAFFARTGK